MPLSKKWKSLDFFGSLENLHLPYHKHDKHKDGDHKHHKRHKHDKDKDKDREAEDEFLVDKRTNRLSDCTLDRLTEDQSWFLTRPRLSSLSNVTEKREDAPDNSVGLVQRCVIIQKEKRCYGLTVSGDNPVYVASVEQDGAAAKAGVQKDDRIVKVNGTWVTNRNHIDVVKLITSGSYVALTLMGRPNPSNPASGSLSPSAVNQPRNNNTPSNRDSARITAPQPVDPDKDRELWQQKVHMTQAMYEQAKEDFEKLQRQYVRTPSEKLHTQLLEKERMVKTLENQLRQLTGADEPSTPSSTHAAYRFSDISDSTADNSSINSWRHRHPVTRRMAGAASRTTDVQDSRCPLRARHVAVCVGENLIVWGGIQPSADSGKYMRLPSSDVWLYHADMDFWSCRNCVGQHPPPTRGASSVLVRPYWYIIGGKTRQGYTDDVYRLHVTTQKWERVKTSSPGLSPRDSFTAWAHDGRIYCFGGYGRDMKSTGLHQYGDFVEIKKSSLKNGCNNQLLVLDMNTQQWSNPSSKGIAPSPRSGHAAAVLEDKVYICGGICSGMILIDLCCLNLTTMTWSAELTTKGPVPERRCFHSLTAVCRDRLLLFGGFGPGYRPLEDLWLLSTATMEWTPVKELTGHPRYYHTACCIQSGNILVFGGGEDFDRSRDWFSRCSDQILEIQIKPLESHPSKYKAILDISGELRDIAGALHDLPRLPSLHDIQLPEKWPDLSNHDPKRVDVVTVAKHDTAMRQHFDMASSCKHRTVYRMQQKTRGLFLLINNESFVEARREKGCRISDRAGTEVDATALCELFTQLGFKVHRKDDCTAEDMRRELWDMLSRDHREYDCFACAILSHGERGAILGTDGEPFSLYGINSSSKEVMADSLTDIVTKSGCKSLAGKPKLFFIQACQGDKADPGVDQDDTAVKTSDSVTDEEKDSGEMPQGEERMDMTGETRLALEGSIEDLEVADCRLPASADLFIAEATTAGFISYRNTLHGTWFMQALVYVFSKFAHMLDIAELMTAVNNLVSMSETKKGGFKQQSWIKSALNKKLYFSPGLYKPR